MTVLVGGSWHAYAYGRGPAVDSYLSPVGTLAGVFLHANYAAAILDGRTYPPAGTTLTVLIELIIVSVVAVVFAVAMGGEKRWSLLALLLVSLMVVSYTFWQNLGMFLEVTIPVLLLLAHSFLDGFLKMRDELTRLRLRGG